MDTQEIVAAVTQIGVVPALFAYTLVQVKKALDDNTKIMTKLFIKLGGDADDE